jgi:hypothetical protein
MILLERNPIPKSIRFLSTYALAILLDLNRIRQYSRPTYLGGMTVSDFMKGPDSYIYFGMFGFFLPSSVEAGQ